MGGVDYFEYLSLLRKDLSGAQEETYGTVEERGRAYPLLKLTVPGHRELVVTAGFHGEEPAGPLTLAQHLAEVIDYARSRQVALRLYPCVNPSGFEAGTRYNASGERPNNDFLRYEVSPGTWVDTLRGHTRFERWRLHDAGPKETVALRQELARAPAPNAALDIHQDHYLPAALTYAYTFGPPQPYASLFASVERVCTVARNYTVDEHNRTDEHGLIVFHDGSVTDYYWRRGVPYTAALETTTQTPMGVCHHVNLTWLKGFIDLAAQG